MLLDDRPVAMAPPKQAGKQRESGPMGQMVPGPGAYRGKQSQGQAQQGDRA